MIDRMKGIPRSPWMDESGTIGAYEKHAQEAIRGWRRRRRMPFLRRILRLICRPLMRSQGWVSVLDVGCGPGFDALEFAKSGCTVIGVDLVAPFLHHARCLKSRAARSGLISHGKLQFVSVDIRDLAHRRLGRRFDLIWANASLIHLRKKDLPGILGHLRGLLNDRGVLACTFFHGKGESIYGGSYIPGRFFSRYKKDELRRVFLRSGWRVKQVCVVANEDRKGRWLNVIAEI